MKKIILFFAIFSSASTFAQKLVHIQSEEHLSYRIHYGVLNAGTASLTALKTNYLGQDHFYVRGVGKTTGVVKAFFKVEDVYESFININTGLPSFYVRNVREGNYRQHYETIFNHANQTLLLTDKKNPQNGSKVINSVKGVQDMISAFYYLRNISSSVFNVGNVYNLNVWIDDEMFAFRLRVVGTENLKTKFGTINAVKIIPSVMSGRVFKDKEGVTLWVTNDNNHIPIAMKAELVVGSLRADLDSYKNVKYPLDFKK